MHAKVFSIQIFPIFASNSAEGLHFSAFHYDSKHLIYAMYGNNAYLNCIRILVARRIDVQRCRPLILLLNAESSSEQISLTKHT